MYTSYNCQKTFHCFRSLKSRKNEENLGDKTVVITGANDGLGKLTALQMAKRGANVIMACRDMEKAEKVLAEIKAQVPTARLTLVKLDLGDLDSVRTCAAEIGLLVPHINILINCAGIMDASGIYGETKDGFEKHMGINHLGHFLFTLLLLDHLKKGIPSRIVCVGSLNHKLHRLDLDDLNSRNLTDWGPHNLVPYNNSKLANILFAKELGRRLENTGVQTYSLCPGIVEGVETVLYCSLSTKCAQETGLLYHFRKQWKTNAVKKITQDQITRLWELSEELVCLRASEGTAQATSEIPKDDMSSTGIDSAV